MRLACAVSLTLLLCACDPSSQLPGSIKREAAATPTPPPAAAELGQGVWMKGDLHLHSHHSTDAADNPLPELIALAESVGMDYFLITDHDNHVQGDIAGNTWADPDYRSDSMVMLYGSEWTTSRGHGNTISAVPYDHQRFYDVRDEPDAVVGATAKSLGIHLSANHPSGGDGWGFSFDIADSIEVWSNAVWVASAGHMEIWDDVLKSGRKITGRGGSDAHHHYTAPPGDWTTNIYQSVVNNVGTPTTWVYARERSGRAVVEALTRGRVAVSALPGSERIELYADTNADGAMDLMMGDIATASGAPVNFRVDIVGGSGIVPLYTVNVIKNGEEFASMQTLTRSVSFTDTPAVGERSYYRVEVQGLPTLYPQVPGTVLIGGLMIGLSNPIYFNFDP